MIKHVTFERVNQDYIRILDQTGLVVGTLERDSLDPRRIWQVRLGGLTGPVLDSEEDDTGNLSNVIKAKAVAQKHLLSVDLVRRVAAADRELRRLNSGGSL